MSKSGVVGDKSVDALAADFGAIDLEYVEQCKVYYDELISDYPTTLGKAVSKKNREDRKLDAPSLVYGEIEFSSFGKVFEKIKKVFGKPNVGSSGPQGFLQEPGGIFYDLGSGTGKPVLAAAILHNFDACYGVELLEGLHSVSEDMAEAYKTKIKPKLGTREKDTVIEMFQGDVLDLHLKDWTDGDIVFMNSTCFDDDLMDDLAKLAVAMKKGSFVISLTKRLPSDDFTLVDHDMYRMSWGEATIFITQKHTEARELE